MRHSLALVMLGLGLVGLNSCSHIIKKAPADPHRETMMRVAEAAEASHNYVTAAKLYERINDNQGEAVDPELNLKLADIYYKGGDYTQARRYYSQILLNDNENADALLGFAKTNVNLGMYQLALFNVEQVLHQLPHDPNALNTLAVALDMVGNHDGAQLCYNKGLSYAPTNTHLMTNLGLSYTLSGQVEAGIDNLRSATLENPDHPVIQNNLALIEQLRENKGAITDIAASLSAQLALRPQPFETKREALEQKLVLNFCV